MEYRTLGDSGLLVSTVGFGTWMTTGEVAGLQSRIDSAIESGVTFFDTADEYDDGLAEKALGSSLKRHDRSRLIVSTKVGMAMGDDPSRRGLSRRWVRQAVAESLARLEVDYIDIYWCHRRDQSTPMLETCRAMDELVRSGVIRYWGVSWWSPKELVGVISLCERYGLEAPVAVQLHYSAIWRKSERDLIPVASALGLGLVAWSPLEMGLLTGKYDAPAAVSDSRHRSSTYASEWMHLDAESLRCAQDFASTAREFGFTPSGMALAWVLSNPAISSALVGARTTSQLAESLSTCTQPLSEEAHRSVEASLRDATVWFDDTYG